MSCGQLYSQQYDPAVNIAAGSAFVKIKIGYAHGNVQIGLDLFGTGGALVGRVILNPSLEMAALHNCWLLTDCRFPRQLFTPVNVPIVVLSDSEIYRARVFPGDDGR